MDFSVPLPQDSVPRSTAPAEKYLIWARSHPRLSCFVPLPPAKARIKIIYIDFFSTSKKFALNAFLITLNELNDYAGQHEVIAENLSTQIIAELSRYTQELKAERKSVQTCLFHAFLVITIFMYSRQCFVNEWDLSQKKKINDTSNTAKQQAQMRHQIAEDSKNEYLTYLQKFNKDQHEHYYTLIPHIFQRIQEMEERRVGRVRESMRVYTEVEHKVLPIVSKCLDGMTKAAESIEPKMDSKQVVESYKSGFEPPGDVEFEDYSVSMKRAVSESSFLNARGENRRRSRSKLWPLLKRNKGTGQEDYSHLPPEQRRKKLQAKLNDINKDIHKEMDQRDALTKMKDVYIKNPHLGDPDSIDPRLEEITQSLEKLQLEAHKFEGWLTEVERKLLEKGSESQRRQSSHFDSQGNTPDGSYTEDPSTETTMQFKSRSTEFDDEFDEEEPLPTIGTCKALYPFEGQNEGTISMAEGEMLYVIEEDKGDGWTRVRRNEDEEGYVPTSYIKLFLDTNAKGAMTYI
uniref:Formin binding protein 1a n=1 Tax=Sinocyclocheilus grahami TaxID=75366 RepID=A0A672KTR2_SINGR